MGLLGWLVLALAVLQLALLLGHGSRRRRDRSTWLQRVLDAAAFVVLVRLVGPWDAVPPLVWCLLVALLAFGAVRLAATWADLPARPDGPRWAPVVGLGASALLLAVAVVAAGTAVAVAA